MNYDIFNGDADGIIALLQLRLADPIDSQLITIYTERWFNIFRHSKSLKIKPRLTINCNRLTNKTWMPRKRYQPHMKAIH